MKELPKWWQAERRRLEQEARRLRKISESLQAGAKSRLHDFGVNLKGIAERLTSDDLVDDEASELLGSISEGITDLLELIYSTSYSAGVNIARAQTLEFVASNITGEIEFDMRTTNENN